MSMRLPDSILGNTGIARNAHAPVLDPTYGGMNGYSPDYTQFVNNTAYIRKNMIVLLLAAPTGFQYLDDGDKMVSILKSMVELHPISVDGLEQGLEAEFIETPMGGGGEVMHHLVDVKRTQSQPTFRVQEKYGLSFARFNMAWIRNLMMDPDSKIANVGTINNRPEDMLADVYSATMAFIEPDPMHRKVMKSWIVANMMPKNTGPIQGRRELTAAGEEVIYDIPFTGFAQVGIGVDNFCQGLLDKLNLINADPMKRPPVISSIDPDVDAAGGYSSKLSELSSYAGSL